MTEMLVLVDDFMTELPKNQENIKFNDFLRDLFSQRTLYKMKYIDGFNQESNLTDKHNIFVLAPEDTNAQLQFAFNKFGNPINKLGNKPVDKWNIEKYTSYTDNSFCDEYEDLVKTPGFVLDEYGNPLALYVINKRDLRTTKVFELVEPKNYIIKKMYKGYWVVRKDILK